MPQDRNGGNHVGIRRVDVLHRLFHAPGELGVALEQRGFESVWAPEHSHIPLSRKTAPAGGGELAKKYYDTMDPFVTLTVAAMATKTLKVGTGVCLVAQRDPIQTAKLVASIDQVSGGRFLFGIGNGWNQDEMENHGTVFATRHKLARERVEAMKAIWTQTKPEYHGEFVNFDPMMAWPKPVQKPHPPVIVGGAFPYSARRAIRYGDGWIPHAARGSYTEIADMIPEFRKMATAAGRDPDVDRDHRVVPQARSRLMKRYADLGVKRVVFSLESEKGGHRPAGDRRLGEGDAAWAVRAPRLTRGSQAVHGVPHAVTHPFRIAASRTRARAIRPAHPRLRLGRHPSAGGARRPLVRRRQPAVHARTVRPLAAPLRLARAGSRDQPLSRRSSPPSTARTSTCCTSAVPASHDVALVLTHGWPGSIVEFLNVIDRFAHPERFGGAARGWHRRGGPCLARLRLFLPPGGAYRPARCRRFVGPAVARGTRLYTLHRPGR